ncbi:hypothetical protein M427DRAFT_459508 [Gonapodya prolifera JEL478]|uniref:Uncharacterized protein n=1 Tax=Gonapodya prolifera (strain JEL478) TaxID=1344416 RepID=A0A139A2L5_GONPJ|nr:hypothetical protein M427DRAFT_459508 [Gonapodya prolifera JEL478]|eukprot:KXS10888.1 hypothetical protein M427DRAFT_459508 [Gonapodya prolifera JEL478]
MNWGFVEESSQPVDSASSLGYYDLAALPLGMLLSRFASVFQRAPFNPPPLTSLSTLDASTSQLHHSSRIRVFCIIRVPCRTQPSTTDVTRKIQVTHTTPRSVPPGGGASTWPEAGFVSTEVDCAILASVERSAESINSCKQDIPQLASDRPSEMSPLPLCPPAPVPSRFPHLCEEIDPR